MSKVFRLASAMGQAAALMIGFVVIVTAGVGFVGLTSFHFGISRDAAMCLLTGVCLFVGLTYVFHRYGTE